MEYISTTLQNLVHQTAFMNLTGGNLVMIGVACFFLYLAIRHEFEPLLLLPIAFGMLLVNIYPDIMLHAEDSANGTGGLLYYFYILDEWAILPSLIFMGVGAMTDFGPLIANPKSFLLGAAAQLVSLRHIWEQWQWDSQIKQLLLYLLSVELMDRHPFSWQVNYNRQVFWDQSR